MYFSCLFNLISIILKLSGMIAHKLIINASNDKIL